MKLGLAAVGRIKEPELRTLLDDYYGRIRRYADFREVELRDDARPERVAEQFARALMAHGPRAQLVTMEIDGARLSSEAFAARLGEQIESGAVPVFAIGGAEGLPESVRLQARWRLSLGPMTLPHRLARLILAEQVYRAFSILKGEPYNK